MQHFGRKGYCSFCRVEVELPHDCPIPDTIDVVSYLRDSQEHVNGLLAAACSSERLDFTASIEQEQREQAARQHAREIAGL